MEKKLKFAMFGAGFWANFQLPAWQELENIECVAIYNRTRSKAEDLAKKFGVERVYDDPVKMLESEDLDFVDILTDVDTHLEFTEMAAKRGLDVVCQKPMTPNYSGNKKMLQICKDNNVKLFINENFRWQIPIRNVKKVIDSGKIGRVFKGRVSFCSAFPVFDNQPFLAELDQFILTDIGSHIFDVSRYLLGDAETIHCEIQTVNPKIKGEDVANALMKMKSGAHCYAEMSYASILEKEVFPQTLVLIEGTKGSVRLDPDFVVVTTTKDGTEKEKAEPVLYDWLDPEYAVVHSSIVDAQRNILAGLRGEKAETTGDDNFKTTQLVWAAYESARTGKIIKLDEF